MACIAWTVTHEEVFSEPRQYCMKKSESCRTLFGRLRLDIKHEHVEIKGVEKEVEKKIDERKQSGQRAASARLPRRADLSSQSARLHGTCVVNL